MWNFCVIFDEMKKYYHEGRFDSKKIDSLKLDMNQRYFKTVFLKNILFTIFISFS